MWYEHYQQGNYQEIYDELLLLDEHTINDDLYADALLVGRAMMRRVRQNIERIIAQLTHVSYSFGEGFMEEASPEERQHVFADVPLWKPPVLETTQMIQHLEEKTGRLPIVLKCFFEEVGGINFVGTFPISDEKEERFDYGLLLDPLFVYPIDILVAMELLPERTEYQRISIAPDDTFKYGYSGSGAYYIEKPFHFFDVPLKLEKHHTTFGNYLRLCLRWGGFPGLAEDNRLSADDFKLLTEGLLPF